MVTLDTIESLAEKQDVSKEWLYDQLRSGELVGIKLGRRWRIHPDDWDRFVEQRRQAS